MLIALDARGERSELGTARVSLEEMLASGVDHSGPLPVVDAKGKVVGEIDAVVRPAAPADVSGSRWRDRLAPARVSTA